MTTPESMVNNILGKKKTGVPNAAEKIGKFDMDMGKKVVGNDECECEENHH